MNPDHPTTGGNSHHLSERDYSADERRAMARSGEAMPDGTFPIKTAADVEHASRLWTHHPDPGAVKAHIITRARAIGAEESLPFGWRTQESDPSTLDLAQLSESEEPDVRLLESDGKHILEVTLIRPGRSKNGNSYSPELLRESVGMFEGTRAFVDHNRREDLPERSVRDLVGSYRNVHVAADGRLRAQLHLVPGNDWLFALLTEAAGNPSLCGLSIDAWGDQDPKTRQVRAFARVDSVDIVTKPAAGGQLDRILQSDSPTTRPHVGADPSRAPTGGVSTPPKGNRMDPAPSASTEPTPPPAAAQPQGHPLGQLTESQNTTDEPTLAKLVEQLQADRKKMADELQNVQQILNPQPQTDGRTDGSSELAKLAEEIKRERDFTRSQALLSAKLAESGLPEPVQAKIRRSFSGRLIEATTLDAAITEEKDTLAILTQNGQISGLGFEKVLSPGMSPYDQVQAAMDKLFDITESDQAKAVPGFSGIREAYRVCTGVDIGLTGSVDRPLKEALGRELRDRVWSGAHLSEAEAHLREADVTTSTFSYLLGTSMNKRLLADYQAWPSEWQKFTTIVGIKDFKQQSRIRLGAFGSLSTVAEDAAYTTLTLSDTQATYTATKRGNLVQVTRETIVNDDLYSIKQIPQKLAVAAAFTLAEFVYNLLAPNYGNIYDSHPLFDSVNHLNTGVIAANLNTKNSGTALSSAALQTAVVAMRKQQNSASKPIGLKPRYLVVVPDLEFTAMTVLKSAGLPGGNNNDINPMMGYCEPIVSPQLANTTAGPANTTTLWIAIADNKVIDTVEIGFVGGQANPVLLIQDMPLYGINFTQDTISYKVRHEYGGAVTDYRGFYLGNN